MLIRSLLRGQRDSQGQGAVCVPLGWLGMGGGGGGGRRSTREPSLCGGQREARLTGQQQATSLEVGAAQSAGCQCPAFEGRATCSSSSSSRVAGRHDLYGWHAERGAEGQRSRGHLMKELAPGPSKPLQATERPADQMLPKEHPVRRG